MPIDSRTNNRPSALAIAGLLAVALLLTFAVLEKTNIINLIKARGTSSDQPSQADLDKKKSISNDSSIPTTNDPGGKNTSTGTYTPPTDSNNISLTAQQTSDDEITISTKLIGYSDGNCHLSITNADKASEQTAAVIFQPQFATCAGFTQKITALGAGEWHIRLTVVSGGSTLNKSLTYLVR